MKFSRSVAALAAASFANAQLNVPECALTCLMDAAQSTPCDQLLDFKCQCSQTQLIDQVTPCIKDACSIDEQKAASSTLVALCSKNGVPITVPPVEGGSTGGSEPTNAPTENPTTTESPAEPTEEPTGSPSSIPTMSTSPPRPTGTGGTTPPPNFTSAPPFDGAGSHVHANVGGIAAALLGLAAYL